MRKDNRGFTLLELIIAISIFSIVVFMGYKVVNGINQSTKEQSNTFNEQQAANLVNKYLTKDLELCKNISTLNDDELDKYREKYTEFYGYRIIDSQNNEVEYIIGINDKYYDLLRVKDSVALNIIDKLRVKDENRRPFTIDIEKSLEGNDKNRNLYVVNISSMDNTFEFKVNPRYIKTSGEGEGGDEGTQLYGEGHIIVHNTISDKSVIINSSDDKGKYNQEIKVSKNNDGKTTSISIKDYKFIIVVDSYINGKVNGTININNSEKEFKNIDINRAAYNFEHENLSVTLRKEEYNDKDDDDDDDLIISIKDGSNTLVKLEKDKNDNDIDVELYNDEIDIEIDDDGEVDIEIGDSDNSKVTTYSNGNEIDIEIDKKYTSNIYGVFLESKQIEIDEVELNGRDFGNTSFIEFNSSNNKLDLEIETKNTDSSENMVIARFTSKQEEKPIEQIYDDIKIERISKGSKQQYLEITYQDKIEKVDIGNPNGLYYLNIEMTINPIGKEMEIKLLPPSKVITINTNKQIKQIEVVSGYGNQIKPVEFNTTIKFDNIKLNPGGGSTKNNEAIIRIKGN